MGKQRQPNRANVFVLMPFARKFNNVYDMVMAPLEQALPICVSRADRLPFDGRNPAIYDQIIKAIDSAQVVIADASSRNPNVYYEMGYAHARGKPVVIISTDRKLPFDLAGMRAIFYRLNDLHSLEGELRRVLRHILRKQATLRATRPSNADPSDRLAPKIRRFLAERRSTTSGRLGPHFTLAEFANVVAVSQVRAYSILNALRAKGEVTCRNIGGEPVWVELAMLGGPKDVAGRPAKDRSQSFRRRG